MVSADNINSDCLQLIFAYLSGNDLVSVSLVSRSFLTAVIPRLYRTLSFGLNQAKRYPPVVSPFATVLSHINLANHVRHIDLRAIPTVKFIPQPKFMDDCIRTISLCKNLGSFTCTIDLMPNFLLVLRDKVSLEQMRIIANFTTDQAELVTKISGLRSLTLDSASWNMVDALPKWSEVLKPSLTSLTLHTVHTLSTDILSTVLPSLPELASLHVLGCPKVDQYSILALITHTPQLQSLAFTSYESSRSIPAAVSPLPRLHHLAIDSQCAPTPGNPVPTFWTTIINQTRTWSSPLKSLSFKISDKIVLGDAFVTNIVNSHRLTLMHLSLRNCSLSKESMSLVCRRCGELETLKLSLPGKDMALFADALCHAKRILSLTDVGDPHGNHASRAPIPKSDIRLLMARQPNLEKVIADGRTWMAVRSPGQTNFEVHVKKNGQPLRHWFMPPPGVVVQM